MEPYTYNINHTTLACTGKKCYNIRTISIKLVFCYVILVFITGLFVSKLGFISNLEKHTFKAHRSLLM